MAIREAILNAIIHRDYRMSGAILISILPTELRISNPGSLPDGLKPLDLKREHQSIPVNPDIAHVAYLRHLIDKVGRGTQKIVEACKERKLKTPKWTSTPAQTTITFYAPKGIVTSTSSTKPISLSHRQHRILKILQEQPTISAPNVAKHFAGKVSSRTVRTDLTRLIEFGLVASSGQARNVTYSITATGNKLAQ